MTSRSEQPRLIPSVAFRRTVLRRFVSLDLFDEDQAAGMLTWPHSGFHVHTAVWVSEDDRAFATRLARCCARNPVALERVMYDRVGGPADARQSVLARSVLAPYTQRRSTRPE
jgi:hypothetical protein